MRALCGIFATLMHGPKPMRLPYVYKATESFPRTETFGLAARLRWRPADVSMKIAEACGQDTNQEFARCLQQARGIGMEAEYQLLLGDLQLLENAAFDGLQASIIEVRGMISGLMKNLQTLPV